MKIDIHKAFDSLSWDFIYEVLNNFGYSPRFIFWISQIFKSTQISILINGSSHGYFKCSRGVRKGNPLSPLLFVLAEDFLSRYLARLVNRGELISMTSTHSCLAPSHFLYTDDVFLFARASDSNMRAIMDAFNRYGVL